MNAFSVRSSILSRLLFLILLFFAFSFWFQKLGNFDFWWHIKTGQYILEHRALPEKDPFTYTFLEHDKDMPDWPPVVLKSFWLGQIVLFAVYDRFGPLGIILFKSSIFALTLSVLWKYLRAHSVPLTLTFIMLTGFVIFAKEFIAERPQIFSFLFAAIVFYLLEGMREACSEQRVAGRERQNKACSEQEVASSGGKMNTGQSDTRCTLSATPYTLHATRYPLHATRYTLRPIRYFLLPLIMLLWANMHRGYPVGVVFIGIYIIGLLLPKEPGYARFPRLVVYVASLLTTFINPVTYKPLTSFLSFNGTMLQKETFEFDPLIGVIRYLNADWYPFLALLVATAIIVAATLLRELGRLYYRHSRESGNPDAIPESEDRKDIKDLDARLRISGMTDQKRWILSQSPPPLPFEHFILLIGTAIAALSSMRYAMFFMIVAVPIVAVYLNKAWRGLSGAKRGRRIGTVIIIILSLILLFFSVRSPLFTQSRKDLIDSSALPVKAVEFLEKKSLPSNIFNDIDWGGYLIWKLYPQYQVFIDTRTLNLEIYRQYLSVLRANETMYFGVPEWRALLDMYGINTIIHSTANPYSGEIWPLMLKLLNESDWHLVYDDSVSVILTRKTRADLPELPKDRLLTETR